MKILEIDVVSDLIWPWCFLRKRHLHKPISLLNDVQG